MIDTHSALPAFPDGVILGIFINVDREDHARQRFTKLTDAEERLLQVALGGECILCELHPDPSAHPVEAAGWGEDRNIRAMLIRWLCVDSKASQQVAPRGIQLRGANIVGNLDLAYANIPFPLAFRECRFSGINLGDSILGGLDLRGCLIDSLNGEAMTVRTSVALGDDFFSKSGVRLIGARIGGSLGCERGTFNKDQQGVSIRADRIIVAGDVLLRYGFIAEGPVLLRGAEIGGDLDCGGGTFEEANFEKTIVKKALFWRQINSTSQLNLDLAGVSANTFTDDEQSWPSQSKLHLDGFVYLG